MTDAGFVVKSLALEAESSMWVLLALVFTAHGIVATPVAYFDTEAACLAAIDRDVGQSKDFDFDWYGVPAPICRVVDSSRGPKGRSGSP